MPGQLQLFFRGENAQTGQGLSFRRLLHKDRLRKIHFARDDEHLVVREFVAVGKYGERVAFETVVGENVKGVEAVFHGWSQIAA